MARASWFGWKLWAQAYDLPEPAEEFRFDPERKYRLDAAWPDLMLALEIHGGMRAYHPSHMSYSQRRRDMDKILSAQAKGWRVLEFEWKDIKTGSAVPLIQEVMALRREELGRKKA